MDRKAVMAVALAVLVSVQATHGGETYYVSTGGNDSWNGKSPGYQAGPPRTSDIHIAPVSTADVDAWEHPKHSVRKRPFSLRFAIPDYLSKSFRA